MLKYIIRGWQEMSLYRKVRRVIMIGLGIFGLWALSPYLYDREVNEAFPAPVAIATLPATVLPAATSTALVAAVVAPTSPVTTMREQVLAPSVQPSPQQPTAAPVTATPEAPTAAPIATPVSAGPMVLRKGMFIAGNVPGDSAEGNAIVYKLDDGGQTLRLEDFAATNGPDLFVLLSDSANPVDEGLKKGAYLQLAALKGNKGNQNYALPADVDLSQYQSVVIWCRAFNIIFAYATLQQP